MGRGVPNAGGNHRKSLVQSLESPKKAKCRLYRLVMGSRMGSIDIRRVLSSLSATNMCFFLSKDEC